MKFKNILIVMVWVAVVSDYMLHPFYPQFFEARFGVKDPRQVGYYFTAICLMVMVSFPFWAGLSKKVAELNILVFTQLAAGLLALVCYQTSDYTSFWVVSLMMILFKGSYLMVYPYILKIISEKEQGHTIGLLSVIVHLGGIMGAVLGGLTLDLIDARNIFLIMAAGDFLLMFTSLFLLRNNKYPTKRPVSEASTSPGAVKGVKFYILKIGLITMILYFSDFLIRPFFSLFWEQLSIYDSKFISGVVYAIPGFVALFALWLNKRLKLEMNTSGIVPALLLGALGVLLQGTSIPSVTLIGRIIFGWAIFQSDVRFDKFLFELSTPENYTTDYSKVHFFQNLGVLLASFTAGVLVETHGLYMPFYVAVPGILISLSIYC
ncbi:MAG: MFS transporter, partial [Bacteroidota bacterium]